METCRACQLSSLTCLCSAAANDNFDFDPAFIRMPRDQTLGHQSAVHRLAIAYRAKDLPRRQVLKYVSDAFMRFDGVAVDIGGRAIDVPELDVDAVFHTDDDPSERWISDFLRAGVVPPKRCAQERVIPRLRVLWLALAITNRVQADLVVK